MKSRQKPNDPCLCSSGKKYKKCCMNKSTSVVDIGTTALSGNEDVRAMFAEMYKDIKSPHCIICGDTGGRTRIMEVKTINDGVKNFCEFCYRVQVSM